MPYLLALDEGTTSARTALYDETGERLAMESVRITSHHPHSGWVEQNANDIWQAQLESVRRVLGDDAPKLEALGVTNQRETTVVWDACTGEPVAPAIVWQCRRTAAACNELAASEAAPMITRKTGLVIDAYFSATKLQWMLDNVPDAHARAAGGDLLFGTIDSWLVWKLTNGAAHVTDVSNASRTMLMNLETGAWDDELLDFFGVPRAMMPRIVNSAEVVGTAHGEHFGIEVPIAGIAGDQQAALAGQACFRPGLSKNTYGTGCFALMHSGNRRPVSANRLLETRAAGVNGTPQYAVEGSIFVAGAAVQWIRDQAGLIGHAAESEALARSVPSTGGVYFVPAFVGLGSPYWDSEARGTVSGITLATTKAHLVRATLESIAYQTLDLVDAMQADSGRALQELRVDGGASANDFLMQFQADILGCPLVRPVDTETTALGAAYMAGLAIGIWHDTSELESLWRAGRTFEPSMSADERGSLVEGWKKAVVRSRLK